MCSKSEELDGFFSTPHDRPPTILVMLTGYLDENGHHAKEHVIVAGLVGNKEQQWR